MSTLDASREKIVLNVGGVKYETYRSTLIAYPTTLLGTMFADRNKELLDPTNGNEYFIDRDGYLFRYIMQFYRIGKIIWPEPDSSLVLTPADEISSVATTTLPNITSGVSREELFAEVDYFQLPIPLPIKTETKLSLEKQAQKAAALKVDAFILALKQCIFESMQNFETMIPFTFHRILRDEHVNYWDEYEKVSPPIKCVKQFACVGYDILDRLGNEIGKCLKSEFGEELGWKLEKHASISSKNVDYYRLAISIPENVYDSKGILEFSCLANS
ncbi:3731_t:CDS:2 [Acaulospora colombiana]|uniref:3731_t:CDS:1 n=1 Tax=Acaulospora colombiana TaxID=27376 RepID=A0ACA9NRD2_9GLOM|nr:3731_t:CDS:2 [Acaulospora colombiana]